MNEYKTNDIELENIVKSASYLEFLNKLDNLVFELLYSNQDGYTTLKGKNAIEKACEYLEKFDNETTKLISEDKYFNSIYNIDLIVDEKRKELDKQIQKHYQNQTFNWADEVCENLIDNCLLILSTLSTTKDEIKIDEIYNRALSGIYWISKIKNYDEIEKRELIKKLNSDFKSTLNTTPDDILAPNHSIESDAEIFLKLWDSILDEEKFQKTDFNKYSKKLTKEDLMYFLNVLNQFKTFKKTSIKDEILLINTAISTLKLKNSEEKFNFIKEIQNDFREFISKNKKIEEEDKISITKRRMKLFCDIHAKRQTSNYYKTIFSNE